MRLYLVAVLVECHVSLLNTLKKLVKIDKMITWSVEVIRTQVRFDVFFLALHTSTCSLSTMTQCVLFLFYFYLLLLYKFVVIV